MRIAIHIIFLTALLFSKERQARKVVYAADEYDKYTSVGNLGLTVTNFGILGNGWNRMEVVVFIHHANLSSKQRSLVSR